MAVDLVATVEDAVQEVPDGSFLYVGGAVLRRKPMTLLRALVAEGRAGLEVMTFAGSLDVDLLVGSGSAGTVSTAYVGLGPFGFAPAFRSATEQGAIDDREYSEWTMLAGLRAAAMGVPFIPTRGGLGSELLDHLQPERVDDPYGTGCYLAIAPIRPDVTLLHAWRATRSGAVQMAWPPEHLWDVDVVAARASQKTIVTVEELVSDEEAAADAHLTILNAADVDMVVEAPSGSWPTAGPPLHDEDHDAIQAYATDGDLSRIRERAA